MPRYWEKVVIELIKNNELTVNSLREARKKTSEPIDAGVFPKGYLDSEWRTFNIAQYALFCETFDALDLIIEILGEEEVRQLLIKEPRLPPYNLFQTVAIVHLYKYRECFLKLCTLVTAEDLRQMFLQKGGSYDKHTTGLDALLSRLHLDKTKDEDKKILKAILRPFRSYDLPVELQSIFNSTTVEQCFAELRAGTTTASSSASTNISTWSFLQPSTWFTTSASDGSSSSDSKPVDSAAIPQEISKAQRDEIQKKIIDGTLTSFDIQKIKNNHQVMTEFKASNSNIYNNIVQFALIHASSEAVALITQELGRDVVRQAVIANGRYGTIFHLIVRERFNYKHSIMKLGWLKNHFEEIVTLIGRESTKELIQIKPYITSKLIEIPDITFLNLLRTSFGDSFVRTLVLDSCALHSALGRIGSLGIPEEEHTQCFATLVSLVGVDVAKTQLLRKSGRPNITSYWSPKGSNQRLAVLRSQFGDSFVRTLMVDFQVLHRALGNIGKPFVPEEEAIQHFTALISLLGIDVAKTQLQGKNGRSNITPYWSPQGSNQRLAVLRHQFGDSFVRTLMVDSQALGRALRNIGSPKVPEEEAIQFFSTLMGLIGEMQAKTWLLTRDRREQPLIIRLLSDRKPIPAKLLKLLLLPFASGGLPDEVTTQLSAENQQLISQCFAELSAESYPAPPSLPLKLPPPVVDSDETVPVSTLTAKLPPPLVDFTSSSAASSSSVSPAEARTNELRHIAREITETLFNKLAQSKISSSSIAPQVAMDNVVEALLEGLGHYVNDAYNDMLLKRGNELIRYFDIMHSASLMTIEQLFQPKDKLIAMLDDKVKRTVEDWWACVPPSSSAEKPMGHEKTLSATESSSSSQHHPADDGARRSLGKGKRSRKRTSERARTHLALLESLPPSTVSTLIQALTTNPSLLTTQEPTTSESYHHEQFEALKTRMNTAEERLRSSHHDNARLKAAFTTLRTKISNIEELYLLRCKQWREGLDDELKPFALTVMSGLDSILQSCYLINSGYIKRGRETTQEKAAKMGKLVLETLSLGTGLGAVTELVSETVAEIFSLAKEIPSAIELATESAEHLIPERVTDALSIVTDTLTGAGDKRTARVTSDIFLASDISARAFEIAQLVTTVYARAIRELSPAGAKTFAAQVLYSIIFALKDRQAQGRRIISSVNNNNEILEAVMRGYHPSKSTPRRHAGAEPWSSHRIVRCMGIRCQDENGHHQAWVHTDNKDGRPLRSGAVATGNYLFAEYTPEQADYLRAATEAQDWVWEAAAPATTPSTEKTASTRTAPTPITIPIRTASSLSSSSSHSTRTPPHTSTHTVLHELQVTRKDNAELKSEMERLKTELADEQRKREQAENARRQQAAQQRLFTRRLANLEARLPPPSDISVPGGASMQAQLHCGATTRSSATTTAQLAFVQGKLSEHGEQLSGLAGVVTDTQVKVALLEETGNNSGATCSLL